MKKKWILTLIMIAMLPLAGSALTVSTAYNNGTYDDDNNSLEDASISSGMIGTTTPQTISTVGSSTMALGRRFVGQAAAGNGGNIIQTIDVSMTWTVTAEDWEEYSIDFSPEFHALMNIEDGGIWGESGDGVWFSALQATLNVNGIKNTMGSASLGLSGGSIEDRQDSGTTLDSTSSWTRGGYTGNNTFELIYSGTVTVTSKSGTNGNDTYLAGLWGMDGTLGIGSDGTFDNYSTTSARNGDGIFVDATVTLNAVPEPASMLLITIGGGLIALKRRFFSKV